MKKKESEEEEKMKPEEETERDKRGSTGRHAVHSGEALTVCGIGITTALLNNCVCTTY